MEYKVCFVGIGSIAKRHIRNLSAICKKRGIKLNIDAFRRESSNPIPDLLNIIYTDIAELPSDYDVVFITNPTGNHLQTLKDLQHKAKHFFIEKPLVSIDQIEEAQRTELNIEGVAYVAGPLKYNAVIQYIKKRVNPEDVISVRSISSSYLPKWRPGVDYRETYSAHKDMGGGVSIDLIHEWDYLTYLFGFPEKVMFMNGKKSNLEIDSDDYAIYIAEYNDKIAEVHLDYFGRNTVREIEVITNCGTFIGDLANNKIRFLETGEELNFKEKRDDFQKREIEFFLDLIKSDKQYNGFNDAVKLLELTQGRL